MKGAVNFFANMIARRSLRKGEVAKGHARKALRGRLPDEGVARKALRGKVVRESFDLRGAYI